MRKLNVAIIGYGGMGAYHGERLLRQPEKYAISGIYDIDPARYDVARGKGIASCDRFHSREDVAADRGTDVVLIATPNDLHGEYVRYFAEAGKSIICEKPVAMSSAEYREMLDFCRGKGVLFMVHQNRRWDADFLTVKKMYDENTLGHIRRIESRVQGGNGIPGDWRKFKEKGGGMMLDWGVHLIDQMVFMFPALPESVYCSYFYGAGFEVEDGFRLTMNYSRGVTVEITVDTDCYIPLPRWMVYGEEGTAVIQNWDLQGKIVKPVFSKEIKLAGIRAGNGFTKTMAYRTAESVSEKELDRARPSEFAFYEEFYDVLVNGKTPLIKDAEVMSVMKIMEAAERSAHENKVIAIEKEEKK